MKRLTQSACLAVSLVVHVALAGCAAHRGHPIVDVDMGFCAHQQCARPKISPFKVRLSLLNLYTSGSFKVISLGGSYSRIVGEQVDRELQQLLVANRLEVERYNACALPFSDWRLWVDRFSRRMEASATLRSQLLLSAFDKYKTDSLSRQDLEVLLAHLMADGNDQLELLRELNEHADKTGLVRDTTIADTLRSAPQGHVERSRVLVEDVVAAGKAGVTKGADPEPVLDLRRRLAGKDLGPLLR